MAESEPLENDSADPLEEQRTRADRLEQELQQLRSETRRQAVDSELRVEALRAGIRDLDGLKLMDMSQIRQNDAGRLENAAELVSLLKKAKPWLFRSHSSSSLSGAPPAQPPRQKLATEMSDDEYKVARAAILRRHP